MNPQEKVLWIIILQIKQPTKEKFIRITILQNSYGNPLNQQILPFESSTTILGVGTDQPTLGVFEIRFRETIQNGFREVLNG